MLLRLGNANAKHTVGQVCADSVLINPVREVEGAREFANVALIEPVLGLVDWLLLFLLLLLWLLDNLKLFGVSLSLVFYRGLVRMCRFGVRNCFVRSSLFDIFAGRGTGSVSALNLASDKYCLRFSKFDVDILLLSPGSSPWSS